MGVRVNDYKGATPDFPHTKQALYRAAVLAGSVSTAILGAGMLWIAGLDLKYGNKKVTPQYQQGGRTGGHRR